MQRFYDHSLNWLTFDLLSACPRVRHAVFLRSGGVSEGPFKSLNTGWHVGDNPLHVEKNLLLIRNHLHHFIPEWSHFVWGRACHATALAEVDQQSPHELINYDGLLTAQPSITLLMKHADCQVALFYDPVQHVAANIHAGWRGSVGNIYQKTIQHMQHLYGSDPANLLVCISPSLGPQEAEFIHYRTELPESFWCFQIQPNYFDFWSISENQLIQAGILSHHIEMARLSTYANPTDYFSYRRDKITGRHATCITLI
jgi:polyphenol oxidase